MDGITLIITIIGGIAAIYGIAAYFKNHVEKPKEQKEALYVQFLANQKLAKDIYNNLTSYVEANNARNIHFFEGVTFENYIHLLSKTLNGDLSNETWKKLNKEKLTEPIIKSMSDSLSKQCDNLQQVHNYFTLYFLSTSPNKE
jgi:hypothetical protein